MGGPCSRSTSSRSCSPPAATSASATRSSPRSSTAHRTQTPAASSCSPCAPTSTAAARPTPSSRACSAPTTCSSGRCRATSCAARSSARPQRVGPARRARARRRAARRRRGPARRAAAAVDRAARALAAARRAPAASSPPTPAAGGVQGAVARLAEDGVRRLDAGASRRSPARFCCASPARTRTARSCAAACRWPSSRGSAATTSLEFSTSSPTAACSPSATARSRSPTRRCCASGRGCAAGSTRTPRAGACIASSPTPRATWDDGGRDRGELYRGARLAAALEWRAAHEPELNATERAVPRRRAAPRASALDAADSSCSPAWSRCCSSPTAAAVLALDQRGRARAQARIAEAQRLGAQALTEHGARPLAAARAPGRRARRLARHARATCSPRCVAARPRSASCAATATRLAAVALSPDGRTLAVGDDNGTVVFLDVRQAAAAWKPVRERARIHHLRAGVQPRRHPPGERGIEFAGRLGRPLRCANPTTHLPPESGWSALASGPDRQLLAGLAAACGANRG